MHLTAVEQGHWKIASEKKRANLPVFDNFLLSFLPLSKHYTRDNSKMFYLISNTILGRHAIAKN